MIKITDYKAFFQEDFLPKELFLSMVDTKDSFVRRKNIIVHEDSNIEFTDKGETGHVRSHSKELDHLNPIFNSCFIDFFKLTKQKLISEGIADPKLHGVDCYRNYNTVPWHKDYNLFQRPLDKTIVCFFLLHPFMPDENCDTFTVSPFADSPGLWGLGFKKALKPNLLIVQNNHYGHEYLRSTIESPYNKDIITTSWWID